MNDFNNPDQPWLDAHQRAWQAIKARQHMTQQDAFLFGASLLAQVFLELLEGNYSKSSEKQLKSIAKTLAFGGGRDRWFEASGIPSSGEFLFLNQTPAAPSWSMTLGIWRGVEAFDNDQFHDRNYVARFRSWVYKPSLHAGTGDARFWPMIDFEIDKTGALYSGVIAEPTKTWVMIVNRIQALLKDPEQIDYLPYRSLGWHDWAV